jgi:hypothetical protein
MMSDFLFMRLMRPEDISLELVFMNALSNIRNVIDFISCS